MSTGRPKPLTDDEHSEILRDIRRNIPFTIGSPIAFIYRHRVGLDRIYGRPDPGAIGVSAAQGIVQAINFGEVDHDGQGRFTRVFVSIPTLVVWNKHTTMLQQKPLLYLCGFDLAWNVHVDIDDSLHPHQIPITLVPPDSEILRSNDVLSETPGIRKL